MSPAPVPRTRYRNLGIPEDLMARVDDFVKHNRFGYRTAPEVVKQAIREFLQRHWEEGMELPPGHPNGSDPADVDERSR